MLDIITKSKIRKNILRLMFSREDGFSYLSEIAGIVETSPGNAQRELNRLIRAGIVKTEKRGNMRYYAVDKSSAAYPEMKKLVLKTIGVEHELTRILTVSGVKFAFIFGSYARNEIKPDSDIDLCIIGKVDENELINKINKLEKDIEREINYHIYTPGEFKKKLKTDSFLKNITDDYLLLTGNEHEFIGLLKSAA